MSYQMNYAISVLNKKRKKLVKKLHSFESSLSKKELIPLKIKDIDNTISIIQGTQEIIKILHNGIKTT